MLFEWLRGVPVPSCFPLDFRDIRDEVIGLFLAKTFQGFVVGTLLLYHLLLLRLKAGGNGQGSGVNMSWWRALDTRDWCKFFLVLCAVVHFIADWDVVPASADKELFLFGNDQSTNVLVLLVGIVLGQFVEMMALRNVQLRLSFGQFGLIVLVAFLAVASLIQNTWAHQFEYRGGIRATGLWINPNTYGLLMGIGLVLALAYLTHTVSRVRKDQSNELPNKDSNRQGSKGRLEKDRLMSLALICVGSIAAMFLITGLLHSFSRGAWLAVLVGCAFVFSDIYRATERKQAGRFELKTITALAWLRREKWILVIAGCSVMVLVLTSRLHLDHRLTRRLTSVVNANDYSWRNRLIAYWGALQIIADHPIAGIGWYHASPRFESFYAPPKLTDHWSIILNDYLTLGMVLGIPALACFTGLIWGSWNGVGNRKPCVESEHPPNASTSWRATAYRGVVIVLLIGFWFDGGLFRLALATPFWLFLELSHTERSYLRNTKQI